MKLGRVAGPVLIACAAAVAAAPVSAQEVPMEKVEQAVKYRQNVMSAMGGLVGVAIGHLRDGFTYGPDLGMTASALQALSADIAALFPEGTDFGETDATAEVWSDRAGFEDKSKEAADATAAFAEAVKSGDKAATMQAFKSVGDACKGCHETYRED
jgi:cytochrome c556